MARLPLIQAEPRARHEDGRGWLQKIITGPQLGPEFGEVYVVRAEEGARRGDHLHRLMGEWFVVVQGEGVLAVLDPEDERVEQRSLSARTPEACYVRAGLAHVLVGGPGGMTVIAVAEANHDPADVHPFRVRLDGARE